MPGWLLALIIALGIYWLLRRLLHRPDPAEAWRLLGEATGLRFDPGVGGQGPSLRGRYREVDVRLAVETVRGGDGHQTVIQAAIPLPGTTGVWGAATHRLVDGQDPWARPGRDHLALARQANSASVVAALDRPEVRDLADAFLSHHPQARIADDWITLTLPGRLGDPRRLQVLLDEVTSTALAFGDDPGTPGAATSAAPSENSASSPARSAGSPHARPGGSAEDAMPPGVPPPAPHSGSQPGRGTSNPYAPPASDLLAHPVPAPLPSDPRVVAQWKRRTAVAYFLGILPAGLGVCVAVAGGLMVQTTLWRLPGAAWIALGGGAFGAGVLVFSRAYRCPACDRFLRSPRTGNVVLDPRHCPHCGAVLRK